MNKVNKSVSRILLRKANDSDLPLIMAWRSNPLNYQGYYQQDKPLTWDEHLKWWESRPSSWREFIIVLVEGMTMRDIGIIQLGQMEYWEAEIGITIGETSSWGKGYAQEALKLAIEFLKEHGFKYTRTTIKDDNKRSIKLYTSLGYKRIAKAREGESLYRKELC